MTEPQTINLATLERFIEGWLERFRDPTQPPLPLPDDALLAKLARWAKAFAIWFAHERPTVAAIASMSGEYVAQHYRAMLSMRQMKPAETDETVFGLAHAFIDLLAGGADKQQAFLQVLADFETDRGKYERADGASPVSELDVIWERYRTRL